MSGILLMLVLGVLVPVCLMSAAGIVALALWNDVQGLIIGILVTTLAATTLGLTITILVALTKRARLAQRQATFLGNVTHELRTPLAAIRLYAQTLQIRHATDAQDRERCVDGVLREAEKLDVLISRVLEWRMISEGRRRYAREPGSINDAVEDALKSFRAFVDSADIDLAADLAAGATAAIDREALAGAVLNLLANANKCTGERKVIRVATRDADGAVEVSVADNGVGVPRSEQQRIFEPFYRVDHRLSGRASGAGLGLAIVKDVARAHGGSVKVDSEPGRGATFTISVPSLETAPAPAGGG
ncbi:MAG: HAMP domain-containing sensor histidine kinase [Myxococcota bacterium]|nr:HAMP domain-containing sensor histidine kinase [Myxococcota bacterium]